MEEDQRCIHWVKWDAALNFKEKGGLGNCSLYVFNLTLLYKWGWRFLIESNSLWVNVLNFCMGKLEG